MTKIISIDEQSLDDTALYDMLFCDNIALYRATVTTPEAYPWSVILNANAAPDNLAAVVADEDVATRARILAAHLLGKTEFPLEQKALLAVIIEIATTNGLDTLAVYQDGSIRYLNYSGRLVMWESTDATSTSLVKNLFDESEKIFQVIGPWDEARLDPPHQGNVRITLLATDGLYFGEGPEDLFFEDEMAGPVMKAATRILRHICQPLLS